MVKKLTKRAKVTPRSASPRKKQHLQYKVVELSVVDEASLQRAINHAVFEGWSFDGVQFAMRESSKRPSMAFVFFTRMASAAPMMDQEDRTAGHNVLRSRSDAWNRLRELAEGGE